MKKQHEVVYDIECAQSGRLLAIGWCIDDKGVEIADSWSRFLESIPDKSVCVGHCGNTYDFLSLLEYLLAADSIKTFEAITVGSQIIKIEIQIQEKKRAKKSLTFIDSYTLMPAKLDDVGEKLCGRKKIEINQLPENLPISKLREYLSADVILLRDSLREFMTQVCKIAPIDARPLTTASLALRLFEASTGIEIRGVPQALNEYLHRSYMGGRVQVFKYGEFPKINVYDVNSMYPAVMHDNRFPLTGDYVCTKKFSEAGFYDVEFDCGDMVSPIVRGGSEIKSGSAVVTAAEFRALDDHHCISKVKSGLRFTDIDFIFRDFISKLYTIRQSGGPLSFVAKLAMNSLYGKFAQREIGESVIMESQPEIGWRPLVAGLPFYIRETFRPVQHRHVGIASMITAYARVKLWENVDTDTVYCDTDSIHTPSKIVTGSGLGEFKLEFSGSGIYCGKKLYCLFDSENVKIKAKGVRTKGNPLYGGFHELKPADYRRMLKKFDNFIDTRYKSMPTLREVLNGEIACRPINRSRRIRCT